MFNVEYNLERYEYLKNWNFDYERRLSLIDHIISLIIKSVFIKNTFFILLLLRV